MQSTARPAAECEGYVPCVTPPATPVACPDAYQVTDTGDVVCITVVPEPPHTPLAATGGVLGPELAFGGALLLVLGAMALTGRRWLRG